MELQGANNKSIIKSIEILTILMIISKVLSLVREIAIANFYGATEDTDAYFVACGFINNFFFGIALALSTVFLPYYIDIKRNKSKEELSQEVSSIFISFTFFSVVLIILMYVFAPIIIKIIAPSYVGDIYNKTVLYIRIYSINILFSVLTNMLTSLLNAENRYGFGAIASIIYSITSIGFMIALSKAIGVLALVISVPLSFFIQLVILLITTRRHFKFKMSFNIINPAFKRLLVLMVPVLMSNATVELSQLLTRQIATSLSNGAVSVLNYSHTLYNFVITIVTSTFITVFFTEFTNSAKDHNEHRFNRLISQGITMITVVIVPIAAITAIFSKDIVTVIYGRGAFDSEDIILTSGCLLIYSFAFVFECIRNLLVKAFYSKDLIKTPLYNSIITLVIAVVGSYFLSKLFDVNGVILAIVISSLVGAIFLIISARKQICVYSVKEILSSVCKALLSLVAMIIVLLVLNTVMASLPSIVRFIFATIVGFITYFVFLIVFKCDEVSLIRDMLLRKNKNKVKE